MDTVVQWSPLAKTLLILGLILAIVLAVAAKISELSDLRRRCEELDQGEGNAADQPTSNVPGAS